MLRGKSVDLGEAEETDAADDEEEEGERGGVLVEVVGSSRSSFGETGGEADRLLRRAGIGAASFRCGLDGGRGKRPVSRIGVGG